MKVWIENNSVSANNKKFELVDVVEIINGRFKVKHNNGNYTFEIIGMLNKGPIIQTIKNLSLISKIEEFQDRINYYLSEIQKCECLFERTTLEEIENDPNF